MYILEFLIIAAVYGVNLVFCLKGSLSFVIDDTASMSENINQIMESFDGMFDAVTNSTESPVENFVLVTFNDPLTKVRAVTKDREVFKNALSSIEVEGGGDCPEYTMSGIKVALEQSLPYSLILVFTDASAKDYDQYEEVKNMALQRNSVIMFILTGRCGAQGANDYRVYHKLAKATSGEAYAVKKNEIKDILNYLKIHVEARINLIGSETFFSCFERKINFSINPNTKLLLISVTGKKLEMEITGPDGTALAVDRIMDTNTVKIFKLLDPKPGNYTVEDVGCASVTSMRVMTK